ncbi:MAG TPA: hypothetical protein VNF50_08245 [Acidimicrobiales bacterium]|nr:hypothetical protein [Acidimicrobiales bacterium]
MGISAGDSRRGSRGPKGLGLARLVVVGLLVADLGALVFLPITPSAAAVRGTLRQAAVHTLSAGTARLELTVDIKLTGPNLHFAYREVAVGVVDFVGQEMDLTTQGGSAAGTELRAVNGRVYEKLPAAVLALRHISTPWVSLPGLVTPTVIPGGVANGNPAQTIAQLETLSAGTVTGATEAGSSDIRGVRATQYNLSFNLTALRNKSTSLLASLGLSQPGLEIQYVTQSVWVDAQGLIRRQQVHSGATEIVLGRSVSVNGDVTVEPYDFGIPVSVHAPPAGQTTALENLGALIAPPQPAP